MPTYLTIMLMSCFSVFIPADAPALSLTQTSCSSLFPYPYPSDSVRIDFFPHAFISHPVHPSGMPAEDRASSQSYHEESNQFMFLDLHTDNEPYYPPENTQPGLMLLIGTSMIALALFGRRMIH
jgi:hypothetical protein